MWAPGAATSGLRSPSPLVAHFGTVNLVVDVASAAVNGTTTGASGGHEPAVSEGRQWCRDVDVACIDLDPIVGPHLVAGRNNPDGLHWGWQAHREIGDALGEALGR